MFMKLACRPGPTAYLHVWWSLPGPHAMIISSVMNLEVPGAGSEWRLECPDVKEAHDMVVGLLLGKLWRHVQGKLLQLMQPLTSSKPNVNRQIR